MSGIGLGVARHLAGQGHRVALFDQHGEAARRAAGDLSADGAAVLAAEVDVTDRGAVDKALGTVRDAFGPIEIMVTSAGIEALAYEPAPQGITVNTIMPSIIDTPMARAAGQSGELPGVADLAAMTPVRRVGTSDDVGAACAFLCSGPAGFFTGQII